jgi:predicted ATP-grasp superfamily ATP-dependent carboligase
MTSPEDIIILGASVRAAAFSALRAGLRPWCADLFADQDLHARCSSLRIPLGGYPKALKAIAESGPAGPWMYTGALENYPTLIQRISEKRFLWGNSGTGLVLARRPLTLEKIFRSSGICFPKSLTSLPRPAPTSRWLIKPLRGAGGAGIKFITSRQNSDFPKRFYFQEFIEGMPCSAVYVGMEGSACCLGATRQLVGEEWLHAAPFHHCGSVGPLRLDAAVQTTLDRIGNVLTSHCHLRGLFGVDFILADGIPWPVEINPRYTASVEVLEYALGIQAISWHRAAFDTGMTIPCFPEGKRPVIGKAIIFAKSSREFPQEGPWARTLVRSKLFEEMPDFADIPAAGSRIECGRPILTFSSQSGSVHGCIDNLKQIARDLDHCLWKT